MGRWFNCRISCRQDFQEILSTGLVTPPLAAELLHGVAHTAQSHPEVGRVKKQPACAGLERVDAGVYLCGLVRCFRAPFPHLYNKGNEAFERNNMGQQFGSL